MDTVSVCLSFKYLLPYDDKTGGWFNTADEVRVFLDEMIISVWDELLFY